MALTAYTFEPSLVEAFAAFRESLYRGDANWIPPFHAETRERFSSEFPFYRRPGNDHRHFIATVRGEVAGHVSAFVNSALRDEDGTPVGAVGLFECVDDRGTAADLLGAAVDWLKHRHGLRRVWGPMDFDIWHGYRFMTRGFDEPAFLGEPYNKPYYPALFEASGFIVRRRWNSATVAGRGALATLAAPLEDAYRQFADRGYRFAPVRVSRRADVRELHAVMTHSFESFLGFTPLPESDFERMIAVRGRALDPRLMTLIRYPDGEVAGFAVSYPDVGGAVRAMGGRDGWSDRLRFLLRRRDVRRSVFFMLGLTPKEAARRRGLGKAGFYHMVAATLRAGYDEVVMALMAEGNRSRRIIGSYAERAEKAYALYELNP